VEKTVLGEIYFIYKKGIMENNNIKICIRCNKKFETKNKRKIFCSKICHSRGIIKKCECGKVISSKAQFCGSCAKKGNRNPCFNKFGELNPNFKFNKLPKPDCEICGKKVSNYNNKRCLKCRLIGNKLSQETKDKIGLKNKGKIISIKQRKSISLAQGGTGIPYEFSEYGNGFNQNLKEDIRKRDNYICRLCGCSELENGCRLEIHHIDYNKKNHNKNNLISLCMKCHCKTKYNRESWREYFNEYIRNV
jgi:hypothetical protein